MRLKWMSVALLAVSGQMAWADDAAVRAAAKNLAPDVRVTSVRATPVAGVNEVVLEGEQGPMLVYINDKGTYAFAGELIDINKGRSLTDERIEELTRVKFDSLPLDKAIKTVKGNGKRRLVVFSDADCPYCRKLENELVKVTDVTIYTFLYPIAHPAANQKSKQIWCAPDRAQAWSDYMLQKTLPANSGDCPNPMEATLALGQKLRVSGTPTLIFANGKRAPGYVPADRIEKLLQEAAR
ncbi:MAG: DsbC family protein [Betaproteobacteria bacterium]|nr:MAG: DsbC family protein [Betaproteobacteria bacterium]